MTRYKTYLEVAADGRCMAHVLDLPGCAVRAEGRSEALHRLPEAIREYHRWLRQHGEAAPPAGEPIVVEIAGESAEIGPFGAGDAAALFAPDREPVTTEEMEGYLRLMDHSRADLLDLAREAAASGELFDWHPDPGSWTIRHVLRHIGNAEEWYVSRLVPPETLPAEWGDDENLSAFEFLEMERRTVAARLRQLSREERAGVFYPTAWTSHPDEAWTARKVLRRTLEHEREHCGQIRQIMAAHRP